MADEIIKKVRLKDPVTGAYLHPETDVSVPTKLSELTNDTGFITASAVGNGTLTVQKNGASVGTFTANAKDNKTINITVPTSAADVSALPSSTKYAASMDLSIDTDTYIITAQLKDQDGTALGASQTIDLPLESVVVNGSYNKASKKIVLTLESGSTIDIPVGDLIAGLQTEITSTNKLSADLIADGTTNKVVTASEKTAWNNKQNAITDLDTIRSNASAGKTASDTIANYGDIVNHDASEFQAAGNYAAKTHTHAKADITDFPTIPSKTSDLTNDSGFITSVPVASSTVSGTIKVGTGLTITNGVLSADAQKIDVDTALSTTSINPVQNKVITTALNGKQATIADIDTIRSNATAGKGAADTIATYGDIVTSDAADFAEASHKHTKADITDFPAIPTVNNATITIQKNGTKVDSFTANQATAKTINITVPTTAADVSALPASTKYGYAFDLSIDPDTYVISLTLKDQDGTAIGTAQTIDLPLESVVVGGSYDKANKKIVLTLESGSTIDVPVGDLVAGLQTQITSTNKLSADLIADGTTNKVVTATEKSTWNGKQNAISDLATIRSNATAGKGAADTIATYGDIVTHNASEFAEAVHTHSEYLTGISKSDVTTALGYTPYNSTNPNGYTSNVGTITGIKMNGVSKGTSGVVDLGTVITAHQDISGKQDKITSTSKLSADLVADGTTNKVVTATEKTTWNGKQNAIADLDTIRSGASAGATAVQPGDLAKVATSGSYADLTNKPTIPAAVTETTVSGWGFTKNAGTVTSVKINGTAKNPTSGVVDLGTVLTAHQDLSAYSKTADTVSAVAAGSTANIIAVTKNGTTSNITINNVANATTATKVGTTTVGGTTTPIYLNAGAPTACSYTIAKSVPSNAVFTDTKNTAGSTDTASKIFLVGATSQAANPQTYSHDTAFVDTVGTVNSATPAKTLDVATAANLTKVNTVGLTVTMIDDICAQLDAKTQEWS